MIRLVISDMDGTIIGRNEQVPAEAAEFISNLEAHGILFTIATGRSEGYMQSKIKQMGIRHPYIATNGATIMNGSCAVMRKQFSIAPLRAGSIIKILSAFKQAHSSSVKGSAV